MTTLHFETVNLQAPRTLLLIHGAFSSHHQWDRVLATPYLSCFHLLVSDSPAHGRFTPRSIPCNLPGAAALLTQMIAEHAKNGRANVVRISLGEYLALYMAQKYPDICYDEDNWCGDVAGSWLTTQFLTTLPQRISARFGLYIGDEHFEDMKATCSYRLGQLIAEALSEDPQTDGNWKTLSERIQARTIVVAGVLDDGESDTSMRGKQLRNGNAESRAVKVEGKRYRWNVQDPADLFARGIIAWMERESLSQEYVII